MEHIYSCNGNFFNTLHPYRSRLITPFELKKTFSDGFRWFEHEWGILRAELQMQFCLEKSQKPKKNLKFSKHFQTGLGVSS